MFLAHYVSVLGGKGELCNRDRWIDGPLIARLGAGPLKMHLASVLKVATYRPSEPGVGVSAGRFLVTLKLITLEIQP